MSQVIIPPWIIPEQESHEWLDEGSAVFRAAFAPGLAQRQSYGGLRLKLSRKHTVRGEEKAQLLSALKSTSGQYNALLTKVHFSSRGSIQSSELLTNNTFSGGTTGWGTQTENTLSVSDRILRCTRSAVTAVQQALRNSSLVTVVQYAPYCGRAMVSVGRGSYINIYLQAGTSLGNGGWNSTTGIGTSSVRSFGFVPDASTAQLQVIDGHSSVLIAGDYFSVPWISLARCALVDNGLNSLLRSDSFDNATWGKFRSSVASEVAVAPDGTSTGDEIMEDSTASATHGVSQDVTVSASAADYCVGVSLRAGSRTQARLSITENTGPSEIYAYFDLSNGTILTSSASATNWSNGRFFIVSKGNGWYDCYCIAKKTNAATSITVQIRLATGGVDVYTGNGTSRIYAWRGTLSQSSVPSRLVQTNAAASTGTAQTGTALRIKGLEVSANGLLLPGDWFEINGEIKQATAALNSDAAGIGYLQFEPALVRSPSDNDPIIFTDPMGKFLVSNIKIDNEFGTQARVSYDLEHIYE